MLTSVIDRLSRTLLVDRIAIFLATDAEANEFVMEKSFGISYTGSLDLSFLVVERPEQYAGHIFFDNTRKALQESVTARETIAKLNLNYYIPCTVQNRTIAVMGLGKTMAGDFLSSEDVELLETLAGYMGIAIQNARAVCLTGAESQRVRAPEGLQRKHRGIHQRWRAGRGPGRPHRVLELADGSDVCHAAFPGAE